MRNPNDPIPGFEDEYTGTVGYEKAVHKTHFTMPELDLKKTKDNDSYEWVEIRAGKYRLVKKRRMVDAQASEDYERGSENRRKGRTRRRVGMDAPAGAK